MKENSTNAKMLARFSTEGYGEYDTEGFQVLVREKNLNPGKEILDLVANTASSRDISSLATRSNYEAHQILDAFIHCSPEEAREFLSKVFDFRCEEESDYAIKSKFFTIVSMYFFSVLMLGGTEDADNRQRAEEDLLVQELRKAVSNKQGSVLLNVYAQALLSESLSSDNSKEEDGLGSNPENIDWKPFLIAPQQYAFDTELSFWLFCAHDSEHSQHGMYISNKQDYDAITEILNNNSPKVMSQDVYNQLEPYFHLAVRKEVNIDPNIGIQDQTLEYGVSDLVIYRDLNKPFYRRAISKSTQIDLTVLEIPVQFQLMHYMKTADQSTMVSLSIFAKKFGTDGLTTFLSLEHGGADMGKTILLLGERLPEESARLLFKTYGDIVHSVEEIGELLQQVQQDVNQVDLAQAKEMLYLQGKDLLATYAKKVETCTDSECEDIAQDMINRLRLAERSIHAFAAVAKTLAQQNLFNFESFKDVQLTYQYTPLPDKMASDIRAIHKINTQQYPDTLRTYWRGTLDRALEENNPKQVFVVVQLKEEVLAAMRVIEQEDGSWYGASFNVNPNIIGSRIGTELLKEVIVNLSHDKPFVADCYENNPMLRTYLDTFKFTITDTYDDYHDTGVRVYQITRFPDSFVDQDSATADQK